MSLLHQALSAGQGPAPSATALRRTALIAGAAGSLGSSVLEQALGGGAFARVVALTVAPVAPALRGFESLPLERLRAGPSGPLADTAFIVFDRERHANGRDAAFLRPEPQQLLPLAQALHAAGVRHLIVVLPHAPALLPQALRQGLASLDEQAVAALGFEHAVFVRSAQAGAPPRGSSGLQGLAHWMLRQLHLMLPRQDQPVRGARVADFVVRLARGLPGSPPGTRVVAPEVVWQASQHRDSEAVAQAWLQGQPLPPLPAGLPKQRY
ncbi:hypothetical protein OOT46_10270 [Aquabacterium sp. A7-Y]|uniref:hypothetical protein n=1 Tax=Aquabacterium sp. A7-Y TaxID=1349605 RepID=UPI00223D77B9|nr:hypothetical protein [Aquabacterium sp. A7-Y]MCW7538232.1 hypothetical protein [Aquabacterium sp. A7-Y]